jgi:hypothetical protein
MPVDRYRCLYRVVDSMKVVQRKHARVRFPGYTGMAANRYHAGAHRCRPDALPARSAFSSGQPHLFLSTDAALQRNMVSGMRTATTSPLAQT